MRAAGLSDAEAISHIERASFGREAWSEALILDHLGSDHRTTLMTGDGNAYGVISVLGDVADLERIAVVPFARRRGLAGGLLEVLIDQASGDGAERMLLEVAGDNEAAIGFYEAFKFTEISRRIGYYPGGTDALIMELNISEDR